VVWLAVLLLLIIRGTSFGSGRRRNSTKTGKFNSTIAEQIAGASKFNSSLDNKSKELYV
jgi:hypothetical protein